MVKTDTDLVAQSTYLWRGEPAELALRLHEELGISIDLIPVETAYMQLTGFSDETTEGEVVARNHKGYEFHCLVMFYDKFLNAVGQSFTL